MPKFDKENFLNIYNLLVKEVATLDKQIEEMSGEVEEGDIKTPVEILILQREAIKPVIKTMQLRAREFEKVEIPD